MVPVQQKRKNVGAGGFRGKLSVMQIRTDDHEGLIKNMSSTWACPAAKLDMWTMATCRRQIAPTKLYKKNHAFA